MSDQAIKNAKAALQSNNYKRLKEDFVSGLLGGTIHEINLVTLTLPVAVFTWSVLQSRRRFFTPYSLEAFLADWCIHCGSILFALTVYSGQPLLLNALLVAPGLVALLTPARRIPVPSKPKAVVKDGLESNANVKLDTLPIRPFVAMYRGMMMVITCVAILAVDFRVFPRRFAKVENWGTSLMDLGVGSFVFSAGVVAARSALKAQDSKNAGGFGKRLVASIRQSIALIILGIIRLISVKGVDYAEHVTEYGVHWNFFFTLSLLPPFVVMCQPIFAFVPSYEVIAVVIGIVYELVLDNTNLTAYIVAAPRDNIISKNREGICSFFGYLAIFLAGQGAGMHVLPRDTPITKPSTSIARITALSKQKAVRRLALSAIAYIALFLFLTDYFGINLRVSRRLANLPYVLWTSTFNTVQLLILILSERLLFPNLYATNTKNITAMEVEDERRRVRNATSPLLRAVNRNGLPIFLLANLLTGAVNLSMKTIEAGTGRSMTVLIAYMAVLGVTAVALDRMNITIKI